MRLRFNAFGLLAVLLIATVASGCASIINGTRQIITLSSTPEGAEIFENGYSIGTTPTQLRFKRGEDHLLTFRLEGYEDVRVTLEKELDPIVFLNLTSILGYAIDFSNGAAYKLDPSIVDVMMREESMSSVQASDGGIHIVFFTTEQVAHAMETLADTPSEPRP